MREPDDDQGVVPAAAAALELEAPSLRGARKSRRGRLPIGLGERSQTLSLRELARTRDRSAYSDVDDTDRPRTRGDCVGGTRPCPWVSCKHHLYLDVNGVSGSLTLNFPDREVEDLVDTCTLDVADRGGVQLEHVGLVMNVTRERIRQLEVRALLKIKMGSPSPDEIGAALLRRPGA